MNTDYCKYKIKKGLKQEKDYIIINQHLWEWLLLNYNGGPEIKLLSDKAYIPSSLAPIIENNEINHNDKLIEENKNNNINRDLKKFNNTFNNEIIEKKSQQKKKEQINIFEFEMKKLNKDNNFNKKDIERQSSNLESNEFEDHNKSISLDASSNKINSVNLYTFNTKLCDFNNKKRKKNGNINETDFIMKNKRFIS